MSTRKLRVESRALVILVCGDSSYRVLLTFFRIDVLTLARWGKGATAIVPKRYSAREVITASLVFLILATTLAGFFITQQPQQGLTDHQKRTLLSEAAKLRTLISAIAIGVTQQDPASQPLVSDFVEIFNRAGIEPVQGYTRPDDPDQTGIRLCIKDLNNPPPETEPLKQTLIASDISFKVSTFPKRGFDGFPTGVPIDHDLVIWIAPKPL